MKDLVAESGKGPSGEAPLDPPKRKISVLDRLYAVASFKSQADDLNSLAALPEITEQEVRLHGTPQDCWVIVNELVYDITDFMQKHPGGSEILWEHLGHDATFAFIGAGHSKNAYRMMDKFLLGRLVRD
ncbi:cytochrome B5-like protein [Galendromus occidentalis]|uniref:Cytochrome B5-like protein n=1 Tax=Galendromus occidentalis TaxID=34638 RepID=A0AAJ6QSR9_9ACAR|nr:cytochrome B5-like protein [Galendromus occidentalis]